MLHLPRRRRFGRAELNRAGFGTILDLDNAGREAHHGKREMLCLRLCLFAAGRARKEREIGNPRS
jgi:hypothetical protein